MQLEKKKLNNETLSAEVEKLLASFQKNTQEIIPIDDLRKKLLKKKNLVVKLGADPTAPHIHLGHTIVLEKLRQFQDYGYTIIFLIGDFTAQIGDPTGKSKIRPPLTKNQIEENVMTYVEQIGRVINLQKTKIVYNSHWFNIFSSIDWITLCAKTTLAQIIERDDFSKRLAANTPIGIHELLYPLLQGYDSVVLQADVEIGGTDQKFNMLMGRKLQEAYQRERQVIVTMPILRGIDGTQKMSKSLKNDIALTDTAQDAFLKIMSIPDALMEEYFEYLLEINKSVVDNFIADQGHIETKKILATKIITKYWGIQEAEIAYNYFSSIFQKKVYTKKHLPSLQVQNKSYNIIDFIILVDSSLSRSSARRLLNAKAISVNSIKITDYRYLYTPCNEDVFKIGKQIIYSIVIE